MKLIIIIIAILVFAFIVNIFHRKNENNQLDSTNNDYNSENFDSEKFKELYQKHYDEIYDNQKHYTNTNGNYCNTNCKNGLDIYGFNNKGIYYNNKKIDCNKKDVYFYDEYDPYRSGTLEIDLHGFSYVEAEEFIKELLTNINPGVKSIYWIHGYNQGHVLKDLLENFEHPSILYKEYDEHNPGVTRYYIKPKHFN